MRPISVLLLLNLVCLSSLVKPTAFARRDKALLERVREKRAASPHMQADFQEEKVMRLMNKPIVSAGKVWFQAPKV